MLYALAFLIVALVAGALGFYLLAGILSIVAKILAVLFIILFVYSLFANRRRT